MAALASVNLDTTALARLGVLQGTEALLPSRSVLRLGWPELEEALPDHGLPRGVIEIAALPRLTGMRASYNHCGYPASMRGGSTSIAIAAMRAVHAQDDKAWCAWITPSDTLDDATTPGRRRGGGGRAAGGDLSPLLYAPALASANVDLDRLLIVRPTSQALARTVVKVAASGAFDLVVIDAPHANHLTGKPSRSAPQFGQSGGKADGGAVVVRKLALAAEECGTTSLLLTSALSPRSMPWPVALRIEVERRPDALSLRITKDRRGCGSSQHVIRLTGS